MSRGKKAEAEVVWALVMGEMREEHEVLG